MKMYDNVMFNDEARKKLIEGVNLITDAIKVTYGPCAKNVVIRQANKVQVTKDGSTVAQSISDKDPYIQTGIDLIREISQKTADDVGDGSSTVALLTRTLVNQFKSAENPIELSREFYKEGKEVVQFLESKKKTISTFDDLKKVATLSANNDPEIGKIIATAFDKVGKDGLVTFQSDDTSTSDSVEFTQGFTIEGGLASPYFVNTTRNTCELENALVYISKTKMEEVTRVDNLCRHAMNLKKSLVLVAPGFDSEIFLFLKTNLPYIKTCCIIAPHFRNHRQIILEDLSDIIGETKSCEKIICTENTTTFIGYNSNAESIKDKVQILRESINGGALCELDLKFAEKRLANFTSGIATINIGGFSQTEINNKLDLYEDAVNATKQAILNGVLPGGGIALLHAAQKFSDFKIAQMLALPSSLLYAISDKDFWFGRNLQTKEVGNLYDLGVIEPFNVVKATLENAISTASQILSCGCLVINTNYSL